MSQNKKRKKRRGNVLKKATGSATKIVRNACDILNFAYFLDVFIAFLFRNVCDGKRPVQQLKFIIG